MAVFSYFRDLRYDEGMKKVRLSMSVIVLAALTAMTGCSSASQEEQKEVSEFYTEFVEQATSLDPTAIADTYTELAKKDYEGQPAPAVRDQIFKKFDAIDPEFFSSLHLKDSSYSDVGKTYSNILLLSSANGGEGVEVVMPLDAITSHKDDKLGEVYEIDRSKITAVIPEPMSPKITRANRNGLQPVKIIKDGDTWKVVADSGMLTEVGIPLDEKITAPGEK